MKLYLEKWVISSFLLALKVMLESNVLPRYANHWIVQLLQVTLGNTALYQAERLHTTGITSNHLVSTSRAVQNNPTIPAFRVETTRTRLKRIEVNAVASTEIRIAKSVLASENACLNDAQSWFHRLNNY